MRAHTEIDADTELLGFWVFVAMATIHTGNHTGKPDMLLTSLVFSNADWVASSQSLACTAHDTLTH